MSLPAENTYDVILIGARPVGYTAALCAYRRAQRRGGEWELVGGECSYWACTPSKAMLRPVVAVTDARRVAGTRRVAGARQAVTGAVDAPGASPVATDG